MADNPVCPETGAPMRRDARPMTLNYKGQSITFDMPGWYCDASDQSTHTGEDMKVSDRMLNLLKARSEPHNLVGAQHHRQLARLAGVGDPLRNLAMTECDAIEEPQGADRLVQGWPRDPGRDQVYLECAHILQAQPVGRAAEMSAELADRMQVGSLRRWREVADGHVLDHPPA
jgi:hypothetical protein